MSTSLVAYGESSGSESEDEPSSGGVSSERVQGVRKLLSVQPAPRRGHPVRLAVPSLHPQGGKVGGYTVEPPYKGTSIQRKPLYLGMCSRVLFNLQTKETKSSGPRGWHPHIH